MKVLSFCFLEPGFRRNSGRKSWKLHFAKIISIRSDQLQVTEVKPLAGTDCSNGLVGTAAGLRLLHMSHVALALQDLVSYHNPSWLLWQDFLHDTKHVIVNLDIVFV